MVLWNIHLNQKILPRCDLINFLNRKIFQMILQAPYLEAIYFEFSKPQSSYSSYVSIAGVLCVLILNLVRVHLKLFNSA